MQKESGDFSEALIGERWVLKTPSYENKSQNWTLCIRSYRHLKFLSMYHGSSKKVDHPVALLFRSLRRWPCASSVDPPPVIKEPLKWAVNMPIEILNPSTPSIRGESLEMVFDPTLSFFKILLSPNKEDMVYSHNPSVRRIGVVTA